MLILVPNLKRGDGICTPCLLKKAIFENTFAAMTLLKMEKRLFLQAFLFAFLFTALLWIVKIVEVSTGSNFSSYGVYPLDIRGLRGILFAPLIHGSWEHLINNSVPVLVLSTTLFYFYRQISMKVFLLIYFVHTFWLWFFARGSFHIGASGIIYGLGAFIFVSGIIRRNTHLLAISMMVAFLYGSMVWGIFPYEESISWEGHLTGMTAGIILAFYYKNFGPPPNFGRKRTGDVPDEEETEDEDGDNPWWKVPEDLDEKDKRLLE